ncbi:MAG: M16 family metallopeptidase, partial [Myxococcaceae bacterium]
MNRLASLAALALFAACATTPPPPPPPKEEPKPSAAPTPPPDPEGWRVKQPAAGPAPTVKLPVFQKATLKNGLSLLVSETSELPVVTLQVAFRAGSAADPRGKDGLADLTYGLLLEGAGRYDALGLADAFGNLGVSPGKATDRDGASVGVTVHRRNAEAALSLLADVVQRPRFTAKDFDRKKK